MNEIERYLTEEIALDHADGHITRRDALHRLGLLGLSAAAASSLLSACAKPDSAPPPAATPSTTPTPTEPPSEPEVAAADAGADAAPPVEPPKLPPAIE